MAEKNTSILLISQASRENLSVLSTLLNHYQTLDLKIINNPVNTDLDSNWFLFDIIILNNLTESFLSDFKANIIHTEKKLPLIIITDQNITVLPYAQIISKNDVPQNLIAQIEKIQLTAKKVNSIKKTELLTDTNITIEKLNNQLLMTEQELQQVIYVTSHDIRSPLVNILGFNTELIKSVDELQYLFTNKSLSKEAKLKIKYLINEDIPELVKYINEGALKIDKLLSALLRLSRINRSTLTFSLIDTNNVISKIIDGFRLQIETGNFDFQIDKLCPCKTDLQLISQVFFNLIDNAIKYRHPEKKSIIRIYSERKNDKIFYFFKDNGLGIPNDKTNFVFEVFSRVHNAFAQGEGIGLTIVKKALKRLNGNIYLESVEGEGSTFTVELPNIV